MRNVETRIEGTKLVITVDLSKPGEASSSGKSLVIGTTEGNISVPEKPEIKIGLNVYTKK
jgi:hypothetical protein